MNDAIKAIIDSIEPNHIFDTHFVISQLIKSYSDEYILYACKMNPPADHTRAVHRQIGLAVKDYAQKNNITQLDAESWSENIHGNISSCAAWLKH